MRSMSSCEREGASGDEAQLDRFNSIQNLRDQLLYPHCGKRVQLTLDAQSPPLCMPLTFDRFQRIKYKSRPGAATA